MPSRNGPGRLSTARERPTEGSIGGEGRSESGGRVMVLNSVRRTKCSAAKGGIFYFTDSIRYVELWPGAENRQAFDLAAGPVDQYS